MDDSPVAPDVKAGLGRLGELPALARDSNWAENSPPHSHHHNPIAGLWVGLRPYRWPYIPLPANPTRFTRGAGMPFAKEPIDFYDRACSNFLVLSAFGLNGNRSRGA